MSIRPLRMANLLSLSNSGQHVPRLLLLAMALGLGPVLSGCCKHGCKVDQHGKQFAHPMGQYDVKQVQDPPYQSKAMFQSLAWEATYYDIAPLAGAVTVEEGDLGLFTPETTSVYALRTRTGLQVRFWQGASMSVASIVNYGSNAAGFCIPAGTNPGWYHAQVYDPNMNAVWQSPFFWIHVIADDGNEHTGVDCADN